MTKTLSLPVLIIIGLVVLVAGVGAAVLVVSQNDGVDSIADIFDDKPKNGIEEIEEYLKTSATSVLESMNFDKAGSSEFLDVEGLEDKLKSAQNNFKYISGDSVDLSGKTTHEVMEFELDLATSASVGTSSDIEATITADIYTQYPEDYDLNEIKSSTPGELLESIRSIDIDDINDSTPNVAVMAEFEYEDDTTDMISGELDFYLIDGTVFFKMDDLEGIEDDVLSELEGQTIKVDLKTSIKQILEPIFGVFDDLNSDLYMEQDLQTFWGDVNSEFSTSFFSEFSSEERDQLEKYGDKVKDVIIDKVNDTSFFENISEKDPIRSDSDSKCFNGNLNTNDILKSLKDGYLDIAKIVTEDGDYEGPEFSEIAEEIDAVFVELNDGVESIKLVFNVTTCEHDNRLAGSGVELSADIPFVGEINLKFDHQLVGFDTEYEIEEPDFDIDATGEIEDLVDQIDLEEILESEILPNQFLPLDGFENNFFPGLDIPEDNPFDGLDIQFNDPAPIIEDLEDNNIDELVNQYLNGEISFEEYIKFFNLEQ